MGKYADMTAEELENEKKELEKKYHDLQEKELHLDISRGKPCQEQLNLSLPMLDILNSSTPGFKCENGIDVRNYGIIDGIPECRRLMGDLMDADEENVIVTGNSTLNLFYDIISQAVTHGLPGFARPWGEIKGKKFLCPAPGYDRHFAVLEHFGFELISVDMNENGPDMDQVEKFIKDPLVKGIICVPKYTNPQGITFSEEVIKKFAKLHPASDDFKIFWDNAYAVHDLYPDDSQNSIPSLLKLSKLEGTENMVYMFASTSKITMPTAGIAAIASSKENIADIKSRLSLQNIGPDKINQLRHVKFFNDLDGIKEHMKKHAEILRPKFETLLSEFDKGLSEYGIAHWISPKGGYFVSVELLNGTAKKTVSLCKNAGLVLTGAGSVFPYGKDPNDSTLRIAPSFAPLTDIPLAAEIFCICARLAAIDKYLEV